MCECACVCTILSGFPEDIEDICRYRYREAPLWQNKLDPTHLSFLFQEDFTQEIRSLKIVCGTKEVGSELGLEKFRSYSQ